MSENFQIPNANDYKNAIKKHFLSDIKQTAISNYEINIKPWNFKSEILSNIIADEQKDNKYKCVIEFLCSQFNADFAIIMIFDISLGRQVIIEFAGDYKDIKFPNIIEIETNKKLKNWLNHSIKKENYVGNIILGQKDGGENFHPIQQKDFKKIGEIIANNLIQ